MRLTKVITTVFAVTAFLTTAGAQDWDDYEINPTHVAGTVHMLAGAGGNIGVSAGADGIVLIDDQFAPMAEKIQKAMDDINQGPLRFVLNTHFHGDHVSGNEVFGAKAPIISHVNVRERLMTDVTTYNGEPRPALEKAFWPVLTFDSSVSLHFNEEEMEVVHFPHAHTDGDAVVFFKSSNVIHMGDILFAERFPLVDLNNGGTVQGLIAAVEAVIQRCDENTKIIPGHGRLSDREGLRQYHRMLMHSKEQVGVWKQEGKTLEEVGAMSLGAEWEEWGSGFISMDYWLQTVYKSQ